MGAGLPLFSSRGNGYQKQYPPAPQPRRICITQRLCYIFPPGLRGLPLPDTWFLVSRLFIAATEHIGGNSVAVIFRPTSHARRGGSVNIVSRCCHLQKAGLNACSRPKCSAACWSARLHQRRGRASPHLSVSHSRFAACIAVRLASLRQTWPTSGNTALLHVLYNVGHACTIVKSDKCSVSLLAS